MNAHYDVIVVGLGGIGSAVVFQVAARGKRVLGLEQFTAAHDRGSSHGESRIIRQAYFEDPSYVPLLRRAYELWEALERDSQTSLLTLTGGLFLGALASTIVTGSRLSAEMHGLPHEVWTAQEIRRRFPVFAPPPHFVGVYEKRAGLLQPEKAILAHLNLAERHGATLHFQEGVTAWEDAPSGEIRVTTVHGSYTADKIIFTAGAWTPRLLARLGLPLRVMRVVIHWFRPRAAAAAFALDRLPVHIWQKDDGISFYSFPALGDPTRVGVKVAFHDYEWHETTADTAERAVTEAEVQAMRACLETYIPALAGDVVASKTCLYTLTPDEHFVVGLHPLMPHVVLGAGYSGHGFKFAGVMGEILADLALEGQTRHPIQLFDMQRFGIGAS